MEISRRRFMQYCGASAAVIGLDPFDLGLLQKVLANPTAPNVIWIKGASCDGCSISFLNRISDTAPLTATEVLTDHINLIYHTNLMTQCGETAATSLIQAAENSPFVLVVEGAIPTAFDGHACVAYNLNGVDVTLMELVANLVPRALVVICAGTCASFGGIPASMSNPTKAVSVRTLTGRQTINVSGCPANPDWLVWVVVQILLGQPIQLDAEGRPVELYSRDLNNNPAPSLIHDKCPRNLGGSTVFAADFGEDGKCLLNLGCRGPFTKARCESCWNGKAGYGHWCIGANAPCQGCVEPTFPGPQPFHEPYIA